MIDSPEATDVLTLESCAMPNGFACLAASILACLQEHGEVYVYVNEQGEVRRAQRGEIVYCREPCLIVPLSSLHEDAIDERTNSVMVDLSKAKMVPKAAVVGTEEQDD